MGEKDDAAAGGRTFQSTYRFTRAVEELRKRLGARSVDECVVLPLPVGQDIRVAVLFAGAPVTRGPRKVNSWMGHSSTGTLGKRSRSGSAVCCARRNGETTRSVGLQGSRSAKSLACAWPRSVRGLLIWSAALPPALVRLSPCRTRMTLVTAGDAGSVTVFPRERGSRASLSAPVECSPSTRPGLMLLDLRRL